MQFSRHHSGRASIFKWAGLTFFIATILALVWSISTYGGTLKWIDHTHEVVDELEQLHASLLDAETSQRGFLITGDESYLEPYRQAVSKLPGSFAALRRLTADNQDELQLLNRLSSLTQDKLAELGETIRLRRESGEEVARSIVLSNRGKLIMGKIRTLLSQTETVQNSFLGMRTQRRQRDLVLVSVVACCGFCFGLVFFVAEKRAEQALLKSERRFQTLFDSSPIGGMIVDPEDLSIVDFNDRLCQKLGYTRQEFQTLRVTDIVAFAAERVYANTAAILRAVTAGSTHQFESVYRTKTGERRDVLVTAAPLHLDKRPYFYTAIQDITDRKRNEEAVKENEARFRTLANAIPQLCWMANADGWIFWYNERWYEYTGTTPKDMEGWGWQSVHDQNMLPTVMERWKNSIATGELFDMVFPLRGADGVFRSFLTRVMPVRSSDGEVIRWFGTNTDITEQHRIEAALRESEERLRLAQQVARVGTFEWNIPNGVNRWTPELEALYGLAPGGFKGTQQSWEELVYVEDQMEAARKVRIAMETGGFEGEWRVLWPNGELHWLFARGWLFKDDSGKPLRLIGVNIDITDRKQAEQSFRESEARYSTLAEFLPSIVFTTQPDGSMDYINRRWHEYTGLTLEQTVVSGWHSVVHPEDYERTMTVWLTAVQSGAPNETEFRLKRADGNYRWFRSQATPLRDERGHILKWLGLCIDIDDAKKSGERLRESQKLEAIGRLAGGVAHDFNNLLTGILGFTELLTMDLEGQPDLLAYTEQVKGAADRAAGLTQQLLMFSRRRVTKVAQVNLNEVVSNIRKLLVRVLGEDIELITDLTSEPVFIRADPVQLDQVLMNLAVNSRDAMPSGGRLKFETARVVIAEAEANLMQISPGEYVILTASDTGCGMDALTKSRLFEPFFTTKEQGKGTGLGLSIVYGVVRQYNAAIVVDSQPGEGATFKLYFPRTAESAETAVISPVLSNESKTNHETVLLVEDEEMVRKLAGRALRTHGFKVLEAAAPREAISLISESPDPVDLVITDVLMPGMRGPELARVLRQLRPKIGVIFISGYSDSSFLDPSELKDAVYIQKPFTVAELIRNVQQSLQSQTPKRG